MNTVDQTTEFNQLIQEEWDYRMQADPILATVYGDHRFNDRMPPSSESDLSLGTQLYNISKPACRLWNETGSLQRTS